MKFRVPAFLRRSGHSAESIRWFQETELRGLTDRGDLRLSIDGSFRHQSPFVARVSKDGAQLILHCDIKQVLADRRFIPVYRGRVAAVLSILCRAAPQVSEALIDISDGDGWDNALSFSSDHRGSILIADFEFIRKRGYAEARALAASAPPWAERSADLVWRGTTTGRLAVTNQTMSPSDHDLILRTRLCLALRGVPGTDVKFSLVAPSPDAARDEACLVAAGIFGKSIPMETWIGRKFALDVEGVSNAYSNLFTRLLFGCCVLKVASKYRQWYYDELIPWTHYVPIAGDLSDLKAMIDWCRTHDAECAAIAAAGQAFAMKRTVETEVAVSVETVNRRLAP